MGKFSFKKIGKAIKKNVSFKNVVKGVAKFGSFIPVVGSVASTVVGSLSDRHEAKKAERQALQEAEAMNAQAMAQMSNTEKTELVNSAVMTSHATGKSVKEILQGALGGALSGAGGVLAGDTNVVTATSNLADNTIMATLKKNGLKYLGILILFAVVVFGFVKMVFKPKKKGWK
jgi:hypothetical protein